MTAPELAAVRALIALALAEDLGDAGDLTSQATIPPDATGRAAFVARSPGVVAGLQIIPLVADAVDPTLTVELLAADGAAVVPGDRLAVISGPLRGLLAAERTALNFVQRLSGIATLTRRYRSAVVGTRARVMDTRKTTPGWRLLEKYAVGMGGGSNHRLGLYDGILIKDNHLAGLGPDAIRKAVEAARDFAPGHNIEVEVDTLDQLAEALAARADIVLLDNMPPDMLRQAVAMRDAAYPSHLEASGGVNLDTIRAIAETGVERISVGAITHSAPALDIGLDYEP
jgi:nicotinate-nucleotide pyrophosphorylase (carboxylating)